MRRLPALFLLLGLLLLTACEQPEVKLPEGPQTVRGYLHPVPFSLKRRGTHALYTSSGGSLIAYAESATVNLRLLEGQDVELEGVLERNIQADNSPVFVVQKILQGSDEQMRAWTIPALGLTVKLPKSWKGSIRGSSALFTASGFTMPVLTITMRKTVPAASPQPLYGPLVVSSAEGELLVVGLRKATTEIDAASESWIVRVQPPTGTSETLFTFALRPAVPVASQVILYRNILKTVTFTIVPSRSASSAPPSGSSASSAAGSRAEGEGAVCGGIAGILCPRGFFCNISDSVSESGVCTRR